VLDSSRSTGSLAWLPSWFFPEPEAIRAGKA
jgi:hypothetical protein